MFRFLRDIAWFAIFCGVLSLAELLPAEWYTFATWDALAYNTARPFSYGAFYRNQSTSRSEVLSLAHRLGWERREDIAWRTDRLGNRNDEFIETPDVILIGDSFLAGFGVSQENTLVSLVNQKRDRRAYSIAPGELNTLERMMTYGVINAPKVVVYQRVERNLRLLPLVQPEAPSRAGAWFSALQTNTVAAVFFEAVDKIATMRSARYVRAWLRLGEPGVPGVQSPVDPSFLFLESSADGLSDNYLTAVVAELVRYRDFLGEQGIDFIFLPVPDKRTVYHDMVPLDRQPDFLARLVGALRASDVRVIDTFELFNRHTGEQLLYFKSDSHWNELGIRLAHEALERELAELEAARASAPPS